jgi:hypothetical protein
MTMAEHNLQDFIKQSLVRVCRPDGAVVGSGFLVSRSHVLTCAHVVDQAARDNGEVSLDFPFVTNEQSLTAWVVSRQPLQRLTSFPPENGQDVALLQLKTGCPSGGRPARLVRQTDLLDHGFRTFGFPPNNDDGVWVDGRLRDVTARGWVQLDKLSNDNYFVAPGFSGGPVWDVEINGVVGMIVAADRQTTPGRGAFMIPTEKLLAASPILAASEVGRQVAARNSCLLIKPSVANLKREKQQEEDIETVIKPAILQAGLTLRGEYPDGLLIGDILAGLIPQVYEAEIVVVDANCYVPKSEFGLSPYLYYFLGLRHAKGNDTILVSRTDQHLPHSLQLRPHTLCYNPTVPRSVMEFIQTFKTVVQRIQARAEERPDNPIQEYKEELARREELERAKAEKAEAEALAELLKQLATQRVAAPGPPEVPPLPPAAGGNKITFRRTNRPIQDRK